MKAGILTVDLDTPASPKKPRPGSSRRSKSRGRGCSVPYHEDQLKETRLDLPFLAAAVGQQSAQKALS